MGEQGAESIHAHMMRLERIHQNIPNDVDRLKYIVREQMLEAAPSLMSLRPLAKKRKRKDDDDDEEEEVEEEEEENEQETEP